MRVVALLLAIALTGPSAGALGPSPNAYAPPPSDPAQEELLDIPLAPIADVRTLHGDVSANYTSDTSCPPATGGVRLLGSSRTDTAGVSLLGVPGIASVGEIGASYVDTKTELVDANSDGSSAVRSMTRISNSSLAFCNSVSACRRSVSSPT